MTVSADAGAPVPGVPRGLPLLFATVSGVGVGNLYTTQPLLGDIARDLQVSPSTAGLLLTFTQLAYAIGIFLFVPLGDSLNRRRLIPTLLILCAVSLTCCAVAQNFVTLSLALALVGLFNVTGQMLVALVGDLANDEQRTRVVAKVATGFLVGILLSRALSGIVSDLAGWHAVYGLGAAMLLALALLMLRALPALEPRTRLPYGRLLWSVAEAVVRHPTARTVPLLGTCFMCVFSAFWTGLTLLLSYPPFSFGVTEIGLVSLLAVVGVIANQFIGRLHDRGWGVHAIGAGIVIALAALALAALGRTSITAVLFAVALFSVGVHPALVLLQTMMVSVDPGARSRLNTAHVVSNFIGSAVGATLASLLWPLGGWPGVMTASAAIMTMALCVWLARRNGALSFSPRTTR